VAKHGGKTSNGHDLKRQSAECFLNLFDEFPIPLPNLGGMSGWWRLEYSFSYGMIPDSKFDFRKCLGGKLDELRSDAW
jgi:hypothetical protein